jgi:hypothetical protein
MARPEAPTAPELDLAIREAAAWCRTRCDPARPAESLRSAALQGDAWRTSGHRPDADCLADRARVVQAVVERRRFALAAAGVGTSSSDPSPSDGFVVLVEPDSAMHDERAFVTSRGFFDLEELPGHDTWLAYVPPGPGVLGRHHVDTWSRLLAWIPEAFRGVWARTKPETVMDNYGAFPPGTSAAEILAAAERAVTPRA